MKLSGKLAAGIASKLPQGVRYSSAVQLKIQTFATELADLIEAETLEKFRRALGVAGLEQALPKKPTNPHKAKYSQRVKGERRTPELLDQAVARLQTFITKNPGWRVEAIAEALKVPTRELVLPMNKLLRAGMIKKKGERRGTTYYPRGAP